MMIRAASFRTCAVLVVALACGAGSAKAQETVGGVVNFLVTNRGVQTGDFERDRAAAEAASAAIQRALLLNLATVPLGSSSSGFLYRLNPQLGTMERATESFGSFFVERALTPGEGRVSVGVSMFTSAFDRLGTVHLRDGSLLTAANQFRDEAAPFDTESLTLRMRSSTATFFGSVGVTDRLEVGGAIPLVRLALDGQRVNVYRGQSSVQATGEAEASGLGDIALRAKYTFIAGASSALAAGAELRLPTGDDENLLGAGALAWRFLGIGSFERGPLTLHGNAGLLFGGVSEEISFAGAAGYAVHPRLTLSGEVLVRRISALGDLVTVSAPHPTFAGVDTTRLVSGDGGTTLANGVTGVKWNVHRSLVLGAHVAFPLVRRGLTAPLTPTIALEYAW